MAEGMISGIVQSKTACFANLCYKPHEPPAFRRTPAEIWNTRRQKEQLDYQNIDCFILAMKPKDAEGALNSMKPHIKPHQLIVSVLAGISISFIENTLHDMQPVIRIMPNTSSAIGASATAMAEGSHVTADLSKPRNNCFNAWEKSIPSKKAKWTFSLALPAAGLLTFII